MGNKEEQKKPKIFISYSHDSPAHKEWVANLALKLSKKVDVIFDQWNLRLGENLPKFMEKGIAEANRVLVICTEEYVKKVDNGEGGAGYEGMIITGELFLDLGTFKFIPVIRQETDPPVLPKCMGIRYYVDLSESQNFDEGLDKLLGDLFPDYEISETPMDRSPDAEIPEIGNLEDISSLHKTLLTIAKQGDSVSWRRLIRQAISYIPDRLNQWRDKYEKDISSLGDNLPPSNIFLPPMVLDGLSIYVPLFTIALTSVQSRVEKFNNQVPILEEILFQKNWNRSGYTVIAGFPETVAFFFQALHGAICVMTDQLHLAMKFIRTTIKSFYSEKSNPLWEHHDIMGWPPSLQKTTIAWDTLIKLYSEMPYLKIYFASEEEYKESICAYYMALNILEYVETIAFGKEEIFSQDEVRLDIPVLFINMNEDISRRAYNLLIPYAKQQVIDILESRKVSSSKIKEHWANWMRICAIWFNKVHPDYFPRSTVIPHQRLIEDIFKA